MTIQLLWGLLGGVVFVLHFLTEWSHHLQSVYENPPKSVPRSVRRVYRRGVLRCYAWAASISLLLPWVAVFGSGLAFANAWLRSDRKPDEPLWLDVAQVVAVVMVSVFYMVLNRIAYWQTAALVFSGMTTGKLLRAAFARVPRLEPIRLSSGRKLGRVARAQRASVDDAHASTGSAA